MATASMLVSSSLPESTSVGCSGRRDGPTTPTTPGGGPQGRKMAPLVAGAPGRKMWLGGSMPGQVQGAAGGHGKGPAGGRGGGGAAGSLSNLAGHVKSLGRPACCGTMARRQTPAPPASRGAFWVLLPESKRCAELAGKSQGFTTTCCI